VSADGSTARAEIRALRAERGRRIVVLDDDPTGSQCVHGVTVVTTVDPEQIARGLEGPAATCFVLTNTRSLGEAAAVELTSEAGRRTVDDVHWVRVGEDWVPAAETEFARDASFGYSSSNLREFVAERSGGTIPPADVASIALTDVRAGRERVAALLREVRDGRFVVVNATGYEDLETVTLGLLDAQASGSTFLTRSGPSFVRALAGLDPRDPVSAAELVADGRERRHGVVIIGSHVGLTSRQVAAARELGGFEEVELDVLRAADRVYVEELAAYVVRALAHTDVLVLTSRTLRRGADAEESLRIAREVSAALARIARVAREARPGWCVAKGGITSHDVAARGLEIRRAEVIGQMQPGIVSVFRPLDAAPEAVGMPYVVFAGNVGDERTLASVIHRLRGGI
jgi:uncharacterized protein YgbK (DUF1537 family)